MIVVMGVTGSGKSYFINKLAGLPAVAEGSQLDSCTQRCEVVPVSIGSTRTLLIDTPGFDDTGRTDSDILTEIARLLASQYTLGFQLKGIIYVHRITDNRYTGSAVKTFEIFRRICGDEAMKNRQLREKFWAYMLGRGSCMNRFHGDRDSARTIAAQLLIKETVTLKLQEEMVNDGMQLNETTAGSYVSDGLEDLKAKYERELQALEDLRRELQESDRMMKRQVQLDIQRERDRLKSAEQQQVSLGRDIAREVQEEIRKETKRQRFVRGLNKALPFAPIAINILLLFVGVPPGVGDLFTSWIGGLLAGDSSG
ncbi:P-loop containing nucleoside triphosphate hydrolase protein [Daldinia decipiens]|uniref:P-loop containing nucleoside triphosphate hydrolase protein n=1 Tax=Daldinia decipiens TaxID=326647 RepID=UPI0020C251BE|nr:P-loop containing nucleoside triphosphate hydrolase protein [Daldinia decipiens]KAI1660439.1 P-loop containing nucleoside triphosphate hydrolase protein [Daldinia decipiens]